MLNLNQPGICSSQSLREPESNLLQFCKEMIVQFEARNEEKRKVIEKTPLGIDIPAIKGNIDTHTPLCIIRQINHEFYLVINIII